MKHNKLGRLGLLAASLHVRFCEKLQELRFLEWDFLGAWKSAPILRVADNAGAYGFAYPH
jgi:hypothetical protein